MDDDHGPVLRAFDAVTRTYPRRMLFCLGVVIAYALVAWLVDLIH